MTPSTNQPKILIVDDQISMVEMLADSLSDHGYLAITSTSSKHAAEILAHEPIDLLVTDLRMPEFDGLALLSVSKKVKPDVPVIVMTAYSAIDSAIDSIRQGAYHYMTKPFKVEELILFIEKALGEAKLKKEARVLRNTLRDKHGMQNILGTSKAIQDIVDLVQRVSEVNASVLITGETGTGKGVVAKAIHTQGSGATGPFVSVNCAALPENLLESELFGHVKGAFTGATSNRVGLIEEADGGTLFLDEIAEMSPALQAKLLHVLERGTIRAVGSNKERAFQARFIAATHRNLRERVAAGLFREDLLYRLDVIHIHLPPLRSRKEDLPILIKHFFEQARSRHPQSPVKDLSKATLDRLIRYSWPGNVRELEHIIERLVLLGRDPQSNHDLVPTDPASEIAAGITFTGGVIPFRELQKRYAAWAYEQLGNKKVLTAETLGVDFKTLSRWLDKELLSTRLEGFRRATTMAIPMANAPHQPSGLVVEGFKTRQPHPPSSLFVALIACCGDEPPVPA